MSRVRWGIVGAGRIADTFARDLVHAPGAELGAVASRDRARAQRFADRHGIAVVSEGYDALFGRDDIDAVYIATPHSCHLANARQALRSGKAVLCEKPLTPSLGECDALLEAAQASGRYLMEAMWTWFLPAVRQAKAWCDDGRIGEVREISAEFGFRAPYDPTSRLYDPGLAGGCLLDIGIYPIALTRLITGAAPTDVVAQAHFAPTGVEDEVLMRFTYGSVTATLLASFRRELSNAAVIRGSRGRIELPRFWASSEALRFDGDRSVERFVDRRRGSGFEYEIEAASRDILAGALQSAVMPHAASRALQEDMERVARSFRRASP